MSTTHDLIKKFVEKNILFMKTRSGRILRPSKFLSQFKSFLLECRTTTPHNPAIYISVTGGNVDGVFGTEDYLVVDWDNLKSGDTVSQEEAEAIVTAGVCSMCEIEPYIRKETNETRLET